jgi:hypothetical protein
MSPTDRKNLTMRYLVDIQSTEASVFLTLRVSVCAEQVLAYVTHSQMQAS